MTEKQSGPKHLESDAVGSEKSDRADLEVLIDLGKGRENLIQKGPRQ